MGGSLVEVTYVTSKLVIVTYVTSILTFSSVYTRSARTRSGRLFCSRSVPLFSRAAHRDRVNAWTMTRNGTLTWSMNDVVHECIAALAEMPCLLIARVVLLDGGALL